MKTKMEGITAENLPKIRLRRVIKLNDAEREIIGASQDDKTLGDFIANTPEVQKELQKFLPKPGDTLIMPATPQYGPQPGVPEVLTQDRNRRIIDMYNAGITTRTILYNINEQAKKYGWGTLEAERSVRRIIADYYASIRQTKDSDADEDSMREAMLARQERTIEKMAMRLQNTKKRNDEFRYCLIMDKLIQAQQLNIENRGWNKSRPTLDSSKATNNFVFLNQNAQAVANMSPLDLKLEKLYAKMDAILGDK